MPDDDLDMALLSLKQSLSDTLFVLNVITELRRSADRLRRPLSEELRMIRTEIGLLRTFSERQAMAQLIARRLLVSPLVNKDFRVCHPVLAYGNFASVHLNHQKCARARD
jgi:hypothetical protein